MLLRRSVARVLAFALVASLACAPRAAQSPGPIAGLRHAHVDGPGGTAATPDTSCRCAQARETGGWCGRHGVGYFASLEIASKMLFEELVAHGHDVDPARNGCDTCIREFAAGGFCEEHHTGFVDGQAYFSKLTYQLARGEPRDAAAETCPDCLENSRHPGWCEKHAVGMIGHVAIGSKADFDAALRAYELLLEAIEKSASCELCAGAMMVDGRCPVHRVRYDEGRPVP